MAVFGIKRWKEQPFPLEVIFDHLGEGQFELSLPIKDLPIIGTLTLKGICRSGSCIDPYENAGDLGLDSIVFEDPPNQTGFKTAINFSFTIVVVLILFLTFVIVKSKTELYHVHDSIKKAFEKVSPFVFDLAGQMPSKNAEDHRGIFWVFAVLQFKVLMDGWRKSSTDFVSINSNVNWTSARCSCWSIWLW